MVFVLGHRESEFRRENVNILSSEEVHLIHSLTRLYVIEISCFLNLFFHIVKQFLFLILYFLRNGNSRMLVAAILLDCQQRFSRR